MRLPSVRLAVRRWMLLVAAIAVFLAVLIGIARWLSFHFTFGEPISREFTLANQPVQLFQNAALQVQPDGSVQAMQLTDPGLLMATQINGLTVPPADPALAFVTPTPDQANYTARVQAFLQGTVPDTFGGQPVSFLTTYNTEGGTTVWGLQR